MARSRKTDSIREYFSRAFHLDILINNKLDQVTSLRSQTTKTTATLSDLPRSDTPSPHKLEGLLVKLFDLENEITTDIDTLVDTKREIMGAIKRLPRLDYQVVLEMRYLCFKQWSDISAALGVEVRYTYMLHDQALHAAGKIFSDHCS